MCENIMVMWQCNGQIIMYINMYQYNNNNNIICNNINGVI